MFDLSITIDPSSDVPVYRQIAEAIGRAASEGRLSVGDRLPPTRALARRLGVNRNTVVAAYDRLAADGRVASQIGRGTFLVSSAPAAGERSAEPAASAGESAIASDPWHGSFSRAVAGPAIERLLSVYRSVLRQGGISFAGSYPAAELMPVDAFRRAMDRVIASEAASVLAYGPTAGDEGLRQRIAERMRSNGSTVEASDVLVTSGAQQAIDLVFRTLIDPGDTVLVEDPTYTGALSVLGSIGARVVGIPSDDAGPLPDALAVGIERHRPRCVYLQPTFHNPTTGVISETRRDEILEVARRYACPIVEDDWASELRFEGRPVRPLHARDGELVVYLSTFSKKLMPGLRVGWVCAPPAVVRRVLALKQVSDCGTSPILQAALRRFIEAGELDAHLERVRPAYRERREAMVGSLDTHMSDLATWTVPDGGLFVWVTLEPGIDVEGVAMAARRAGVTLNPGSLFHVDGRDARSIRLTYASTSADRIEQGVRTIAAIVRERRTREDLRGDAALGKTVPVF